LVRVIPNERGDWINQPEHDWSDWLPVASKDGKAGKNEGVIFKLFSLGVVTNRDEWVYGYTKNEVSHKIRYLIKVYHDEVDGKVTEKLPIKWTRSVKKDLKNGKRYSYSGDKIIKVSYRPFCSKWLYFDKHLNEMRYQTPVIYGENGQYENLTIYFTDTAGRSPFSSLATKTIGELHLCSSSDGFQSLPLWIYAADGSRHDNVTDWSLKQFRANYPDEIIEKRDIFNYVYAVLNNPSYREKYARNLKVEFPRIPFYTNFHQWATWGKRLIDLHTGYTRLSGFPLVRIDLVPPFNANKPKQSDLSGIDTSGKQDAFEMSEQVPKSKLKADQTTGVIMIDANTRVEGIPPEAWHYQLGSRSALEWVMYEYADFTPKDPTIREKFNIYRFADHKEDVIVLLGQVCRVSIETVAIMKEMRDSGEV
jgi:predicted helicase